MILEQKFDKHIETWILFEEIMWWACSNTKIGVKNKKMDMDEARILEGQTHRHTSGHNSMTQKIMKKKILYLIKGKVL